MTGTPPDADGPGADELSTTERRWFEATFDDEEREVIETAATLAGVNPVEWVRIAAEDRLDAKEHEERSPSPEE